MNQNERAGRLVSYYADTILRLSYTYLKSAADAQDVCQEVLIKLVMENRTFESPAHEKAWVLRVTSNACKDLLKSAWRRRVCVTDTCPETAVPEEPDGELLETVNQLPPKYRAVIYLYYYEGYSAAEIGQILRLPAATVNTRLARGRAQLKKMLGGMNYEHERA